MVIKSVYQLLRENLDKKLVLKLILANTIITRNMSQ